MNMTSSLSAIARLDTTARSSAAVTHAGTGYFAITPERPYDASLTTVQQARQLFARAEKRLADIGSGKDRLLFTAILLADLADLVSFNAAWDEWLSDVAPPARACFQADLADPAMKVEMIVICATIP